MDNSIMTIKEVEERTGLARSTIRFYEKEKLIKPDRNESNGYRSYTEEDVENIKKIAYLRTLGIPLENIHQIINHEVELRQVIDKQSKVLGGQITDLKKSKSICQKMLAANNITYDDLDIEAYVPELTEYWETNEKVFRVDSVSFLYLWGGTLVWGIITGICLVVALLSYPYLPKQIPIQWNNGEISSEVQKIFIFVYPITCIAIRFLLRPFIWRWLKTNFNSTDAVGDYVTNYLCFIVLSVEVFTVFFIIGIVKHITTVLLVDTIVIIGILLIGWKKWDLYKLKR